MHIPIGGDRMNGRDELGEALRALPLATPAGDLWPALERSLAPRRPRWHVPTTIAAALLFGFVGVRLGLHESDDASNRPATTIADATPVNSELERLRTQSRELEHWLAARPAQTDLGASTLMAAAEVEDLVGFVDVQLSAARDDGEALPLWRQRVGLLEDLVLIRSTNQFETAALAGDPAFMPVSL
ncbi:MAG TPA: hypothetical protein PKO41_02030 [Dokdonella sp.]|uniref:hypothetical protein n=1 Tax=Dokdonella sp. TaxID=2291710 RepID=UPI0025C72441|nr:hypothetical protein [Dokdonella sp.]MBX3690916.1 hypothetical protein [Dokdonella sp.]HNR91181.1 hypothetical protein [Dokdonella sp.]